MGKANCFSVGFMSLLIFPQSKHRKERTKSRGNFVGEAKGKIQNQPGVGLKGKDAWRVLSLTHTVNLGS